MLLDVDMLFICAGHSEIMRFAISEHQRECDAKQYSRMPGRTAILAFTNFPFSTTCTYGELDEVARLPCGLVFLDHFDFVRRFRDGVLKTSPTPWETHQITLAKRINRGSNLLFVLKL